MDNITRKKTTGEPGNGGEFGSKRNTDAEDGLLDQPADTRDWGTVNLREGDRSPWGTIQHATHVADGITRVDTAGHGGHKLSRERNAAVHPKLRRSGGWYEEDCEAHIVGFTFPEECRPRKATGYVRDYDVDEYLALAKDGVRRWYPDGFEAATGETVFPGQSSERDRAVWEAEHKDDYISTNWKEDPTDPEHRIVTAKRNGEERKFRIHTTEHRELSKWDNATQGRLALDPARHEILPAEPKVPRKQYGGIDTSKLTEKQRERAEKELNTRYRFPDGVKTMRQVIEAGVSEKTSFTAGKSKKYFITIAEHEGDTGRSYSVGKAVFDALDAPERD